MFSPLELLEFSLGGLWGHFRRIWGALGAPLGSLWDSFGLLGGDFGCRGHPLGSILEHFGIFWHDSRCLLCAFGSQLHVLGVLWSIIVSFYRIFDRFVSVIDDVGLAGIGPAFQVISGFCGTLGGSVSGILGECGWERG